MKRCLALVAVLAVLAGCAAPVAPPPAPAAPVAASFEAWYREAAAAGRPVFAIDAQQSIIAVTVRRAGPLARLGHDHLIASRSVTGFAAPADGRADFQFRLDQMSVDEPDLRLQARLDTQPSAAAIAGTRENMLKRVLQADRFPVVLLHAERLPAGATIRLAITLHGVTRTLEVPTRIETSARSVVASGELRLRQSEFGIVPMSVMAGALAVEDEMELRFRIVAKAR
jgi:polyisoprenoid-binding protein YceI